MRACEGINKPIVIINLLHRRPMPAQSILDLLNEIALNNKRTTGSWRFEQKIPPSLCLRFFNQALSSIGPKRQHVTRVTCKTLLQTADGALQFFRKPNIVLIRKRNIVKASDIYIAYQAIKVFCRRAKTFTHRQ